MKMYKKIFAAIDKDKDGVLSKEDIRDGLKYFVDYRPTKSELDAAMKFLGTNTKSEVNFEDFLNFISFIKRTAYEQYIKTAFEYADTDRDGYLSKRDLQKSFNYLRQNVGLVISKELIAKLFELSDKSENGMISYTDFQKIFNNQM